MRMFAEVPVHFCSFLLMVTAAPVTAADATAKAKSSTIRSTSDLEDALVTARTDNKPVYLAFGAAWCPGPQRMLFRN